MNKNKSEMSTDEKQSDLQWQIIDKHIRQILFDTVGTITQTWAAAYTSQRFGGIEPVYTSNVLMPAMIVALNNLAVLHCQQAKYLEAEREFKQVCLYSRYHAQTQPELFLPIVADSLNSLGLLYQFSENYEKAEAALTGAVSIYDIADTHFRSYGQSSSNSQIPLDWLHRVNIAFTARGDKFFDQEKLSRLDELMKKWRKARDESKELSIGEQEELDRLIDEELEATIARLEDKEKLGK